VISSDSLFRQIAASPDDRVDARGLLAARLFDILIGDWDRNRGQWRWATFGDSLPRIWHPIAVDRDQSFARFDGVLLLAARQVAPQLPYFYGNYPNIEAATNNGRELDRRFLAQLERQVWDSVTLAMQTALSDSLLSEAVLRLPGPHAALSADMLLSALKERREKLPRAADAF
jgi:hypothetical protein